MTVMKKLTLRTPSGGHLCSFSFCREMTQNLSFGDKKTYIDKFICTL